MTAAGVPRATANLYVTNDRGQTVPGSVPKLYSGSDRQLQVCAVDATA